MINGLKIPLAKFEKPYRALQSYEEARGCPCGGKIRNATRANPSRPVGSNNHYQLSTQTGATLGKRDGEEYDPLEVFAGSKRPMKFNRKPAWKDVEKILKRWPRPTPCYTGALSHTDPSGKRAFRALVHYVMDLKLARKSSCAILPPVEDECEEAHVVFGHCTFASCNDAVTALAQLKTTLGKEKCGDDSDNVDPFRPLHYGPALDISSKDGTTGGIVFLLHNQVRPPK